MLGPSHAALRRSADIRRECVHPHGSSWKNKHGRNGAVPLESAFPENLTAGAKPLLESLPIDQHSCRKKHTEDPFGMSQPNAACIAGSAPRQRTNTDTPSASLLSTWIGFQHGNEALRTGTVPAGLTELWPGDGYVSSELGRADGLPRSLLERDLLQPCSDGVLHTPHKLRLDRNAGAAACSA